MWLVLSVAGALAVATGYLPWSDATTTAQRVWPVLLFLIAVTVLAELAQRAGVFRVAADAVARAAGGRTRLLLLLVCGLGTLTTITLSLDTTAVLLTPVVLTLATTLELPPWPFALAAVWLANTASLLLPVSNLTNLLAQDRLGLSGSAFAGQLVLPAVAVVAVTVVVLFARFGRGLPRRYDAPAAAPPPDRVVFAVAVACCVALAPAVLLGAPPWTAAVPAALVLAATFAVRRQPGPALALLPWRIVLLTAGLFLVVAAVGVHGLNDLLGHALGGGQGAAAQARAAGVAAGAANAVNNLPAYLALEAAVPRGSTGSLLAVLLGVNVGPLILLHGSLATLLWRERCRAAGVTVSARRFAAEGLLLVPAALVAGWAALQVA
jgi:arsenical pump membrane protein